MFGFEEQEDEETVEQPLPRAAMPEQGGDKIENPMVRDYLMRTYGEKYSDDARQKLVEQNEKESSGGNWRAALSALGAGLSGRDANAAGMDVIKMQDGARNKKLADFDAGRKEKLMGADMERKLAEFKKTDDAFARESDPNSAESQVARDLAVSMGMNPEIAAKLTAAKFKELSPTLTKRYEIEQKKISDQSERNFKQQEFGLKRQESAAKLNAEAPKRAFDNLPEEKKRTINGLADKNGAKLSIANSIEAVTKNWDSWTDEEKLQQGRELIKTLNSTQGSDAVGVEESKRLAGKLQFAMGNLTNDNPIQFGRDLDGFKNDAMNTTKVIRDSIAANDKVINEAYGRESSGALAASKQDEAAMQWALKNPTDPRAKKIINLNGQLVAGAK